MRVLLLATLLAAPCAAQPAPEDDAVGCYRLDHALWPDGLDHLPSPDHIPKRLELTDDPLLIGIGTADGTVKYVPPPDIKGARRVRYAGLPDGAGPFEFWVVEDGRLVLSRYIWFVGFTVEATRAGDDWEGTLTGSTDYIPADGHASESVALRLVREPCPVR